ncbi:SRPBCC domain-containing protein [Streptomyces sp. NBC_01236]|uniref:SRPBCC domain-containing protein n=1 Tax=Streptomyces sp. NBC_01236 TaxID=2903789 RepID=UPI002E0DCA7F|nr:SRPBCC domain-containing protein [Streptomyces sp. NBC_01236]
MSDDRIERDTLIAAPMERVWSLVATPGFWVADEASVAGTVATEGATMLAKNPNLGEVYVRVEKVEAPTYVAYRWTSAFPGEELRDDNSTLVEFTLTAEDGKTRLRVVESGFSALATAPELRDQAVRFNTDGWSQIFDIVRARTEESAV